MAGARIKAILLLCGIAVPVSASAQLDPSSAILLRSGSSEPPKVPLDSGRYTVRPSTNSSPVASPPAPTQAPTLPPPAIKATSAAQPVPKVEKQEPALEPPAPQMPDQNVPAAEPEPQISPHWNLVELSFAPSFIYANSSSNYWFRDYYTSGPGFAFGATVWPAKGFGVAMNFETTLNSTVSDSPGSKNKEAADHQWFSSGLRFRRNYGSMKRPSSVVFGLDYSEYQLHVPPDATQRFGVKTLGVQASVEAQIQSSTGFAWRFGGLILPRAEHKESDGAAGVKSGARSDSAAFGVWLGGVHTFDRRNQIFWTFRHTIERNVYEGAATVADPVTGVAPEGVSVQQSFSIFQFGYRWGS